LSLKSLVTSDPRSNRGYVQPGRERVTQSTNAAEIAALRLKAPDSKETFEIGREENSQWKNQWPPADALPNTHFREFFIDFFGTCHLLHMEVMRSVALGLGLKEEFFEDKIGERYHNLRLLSYPPIEAKKLTGDGQARAGTHSGLLGHLLLRLRLTSSFIQTMGR
jgi:isopenicillin N synthase-like dioxygenase